MTNFNASLPVGDSVSTLSIKGVSISLNIKTNTVLGRIWDLGDPILVLIMGISLLGFSRRDQRFVPLDTCFLFPTLVEIWKKPKRVKSPVTQGVPSIL